MAKRIVFSFCFIVFLAGCSANQQNTQSYDEVKKIMLDALQSEDGKKAIRQLLEDNSFRDLVILENEEVKKAIEETLLSKKSEEYWKKQFEDPKFRETFAKSMKKEQEGVMKDLIKDASFQKDLEQFFGQPDMQKQLEKILKSANSKENLEKIIAETIESPLLQEKWLKLIQSAGESGGGGEKSKGGKSGDESSGDKQKQ
ncbi:spore germination lipoprotein GerD [Viridibacillus sp. FSL R5-0477]|uniref:Spore germination protein gerD n=1 Tax=Viridibacillus arenosi FSL R5-213 TaxID=1227360 RepID=W4F744_9BACL|nr:MULTISPECIES: spore germination lipoprotein GerD [Viridibacillus]ETT88713.1 spore germination protein gerD [Viridibacillus arenosi FSL R5-213]OMC81259.1 spore gernimation protein [Viridibacillus sp. FSL H8-0123]OMC84988.1 spore gernimation protein [Viridibacillus sp. FSL H7-0596]OMC90321.1 spore gernimation protein [Viridibacillus arenosi]